MPGERLKNLFAFLEEDANDPFTLYSIAYEYAQQEDFPSAITYFLELKEKHPDYLGLYYHLGKAHEVTGNTQEAEIVYRDGISRSRKKGEFHTLSELQGSLNRLLGLDFEDEV